MRPLSIVYCVGLAWFAMSASPSLAQPPQSDEATNPKAILRTSQDRDALLGAALTLARSQASADLDALLDFLADPKFLERIEPPAPYEPSMARRVGKVLAALAQNSTMQPEAALFKLTESKVFMKDYSRCWVLIKAFTKLEKSSPRVLEFLASLEATKRISSVSYVATLAQIRTPLAWDQIDLRFAALESEQKANVLAPVFFGLALYEARDETRAATLFRNLAVSPEKSNFQEFFVKMIYLDSHHWLADGISRGAIEDDEDYVMLPMRGRASTGALVEYVALADELLQRPLPGDLKRIVSGGRQAFATILEYRKAGGPQRVDELIRDLDSAKFQTREQASDEIKKYGRLAEPALLDALAKEPSLETVLRIRRILAHFDAVDAAKVAQASRAFSETKVWENLMFSNQKKPEK